eukprot:scaffold18000_cov44-Attheya_sp.AAC.2
MNQKKISRAAAHNDWMKILGYQYNELTKGFYTDNHEKEENIRYQIKFIRRYLFEYEPYMLRWIQIPISTVKEAYDGRKINVKVESGEENSKGCVITVEKEAVDTIMSRGRTYQDDEGNDMIELHIDSIDNDPPELVAQIIKKNEEENGGMG